MPPNHIDEPVVLGFVKWFYVSGFNGRLIDGSCYWGNGFPPLKPLHLIGPWCLLIAPRLYQCGAKQVVEGGHGLFFDLGRECFLF